MNTEDDMKMLLVQYSHVYKANEPLLRSSSGCFEVDFQHERMTMIPNFEFKFRHDRFHRLFISVSSYFLFGLVDQL